MSKKNEIIFVFEDENDAKEVISCLTQKIEITWNNETRVAMLKVLPKEMKVLVSKSAHHIPKPLRV